MKIPSSITKEHHELHQELSKLIALGGKTGKLAQKVADLLHPHFVLEEKLAMPLLGLLEPLSKNKKPGQSKLAIKTFQSLEKNLPQMLAEHQKIVKALNNLAQEAPEFARKLKLHAQNEEEVL